MAKEVTRLPFSAPPRSRARVHAGCHTMAKALKTTPSQEHGQHEARSG